MSDESNETSKVAYYKDPGAVTDAIAHAFIEDIYGLCDGALQTNDGFTVPVSKAVLAARFPSFRTLFYMSTESSMLPTFFIVPTTKNLIDHIIEFAYTNDCELLTKGRKNLKLYRSQKAITHSLRPLVIELLALMNASHQLDVPPLKKCCELLLISFTKRVPCTICTILQEISRLQSLYRFTENNPFQELLSSATTAIVQNPDESLLMSLDHQTGVVADAEQKVSEVRLYNVADLDSAAVARVIDQSQLDQQKAFEVLYFWASAGRTLTEQSQAFEPKTIPQNQRWECAREFVKRLALSDVSSAFLTRCVGPSKLVADVQMSELYRTQLLKIEEQKDARKDRKRRLSGMEKEVGIDDAQETVPSNGSETESMDSESESSSSGSDSESGGTKSASSSSSGSDSESNETASEGSSTSGSDSESSDSESETSSDGGNESRSDAGESGYSSESGSDSDSEESEANFMNEEPEIQPRPSKRRRKQSD